MVELQQIERLADAAGRGDDEALELLLPLVYEDLRLIARRTLRVDGPTGSLNTTGLVHEAYLRLYDHDRTSWEGRSHVLGVAATAMRRILVNRGEARRCLKRGGAHGLVALSDVDPAVNTPEVPLIDVDDALERLARVDERKARLVELRFFAGLSLQETAAALEISVKTAKRDWAVAKLWILRDIERHRPHGS